MKVKDIMLPIGSFPILDSKTILKEAFEIMGKYGLGISCIVDEKKVLLGILTDGDIRRKLLKIQKPLPAFLVDDVLEHAILNPETISPVATVSEAINKLNKKVIWDLPVVEENNTLVGILHMHTATQIMYNKYKNNSFYCN